MIGESNRLTHHMNDFMILMENYGKAQEYMTTAQESSGESMKKYEAYQDSLSGKLENLKGSFQAMSTTLLNDDVMKAKNLTKARLKSYMDT